MFSTTGSEYKDFVCNTCLKKLNELLDIPARCLTLAKYERAVYARKEECIRRNIAGSFGDCLASKNAIIPFILECSVKDVIYFNTFHLSHFTELHHHTHNRGPQWETRSTEEKEHEQTLVVVRAMANSFEDNKT